MLLHGGAIDLMKTRFPDAPKPWLDLSTGINPWSYAYSETGSDVARHLPTAAQFSACRQAIATATGTPAENLLLAPGSELLIRILPTVLPARLVCVTSGSYADHLDVWQQHAETVSQAADPLEHAQQADAVVVCNPNNPDGRTWTVNQLQDARRTLAERNKWLIIDEAYADLVPDHSMAPYGGADGLIIFRSFGKFFGLAGIRLGALIAPADVLEAINKRLGVWPVAGPTLQIAENAYKDVDWQINMRHRLKIMRKAMDSVLEGRGLRIVGGTDLYRFVQTTDARKYWRSLAEHGIYTRQFNWCKHSLRLGITSSEEALHRLSVALSTIRISK